MSVHDGVTDLAASTLCVVSKMIENNSSMVRNFEETNVFLEDVYCQMQKFIDNP